MSYLKAIFVGLTLGLSLAGVAAIQEVNYYVGTIAGIAALFLGLIVVSAKGK